MSLRFGTDGVRARAFDPLSEEYLRALGAAAARVLDGDRLAVGRDSRESGPALQHAFAQGCTAEGVTVVDLGLAPTPAVAWWSRVESLPAAVLSASHNPWHDNGVKLFEPGGLKLSDDDQDAIQHLLDDGLTVTETDPDIRPGSIDGYVDSVVESVEGRSFSGMRVVLDCANGAASATAATVFGRLDADVLAVANSPDGRNINAGVGSNHPDHVASVVRDERVSVGFAFDGDADRVIGCGFDGSTIDGDQILAMAGIDRHDHGDLAHDTVVTTVMANLGLRRAMSERGIAIVETPVGDRHVLEALDRGGFALGGEQSGHIIFRDLATTGDGVLTAVQLLDASVRRGADLGDWARSVMTRYPQVLRNVPVESRVEDLGDRLADAVQAEQQALGAEGRILVRPSGTEPLVRVMVEAAEGVGILFASSDLQETIGMADRAIVMPGKPGSGSRASRARAEPVRSTCRIA